MYTVLNTFPQLLFPYYAPIIVRVGVAAALFYLAYKQYARREEIAKLRPTLGSNLVWLSVICNAAVGLMLILGYYTQVAAMLAALSQVMGLWANRRYPSVVILANSAVILLIVMSLSLIVSGAGAVARDLPL